MGNSQSHHEGQHQGSKQGTSSPSINHPKMKSVKFMQNNEIMRSLINVENEDDFHEWESRLSRLKNFDQYYLLLPKAYSFSRKAVCGSSGILQADYDNYPYLLSQEIQNRMPSNNYFNQAQLWYLFYGLLSAASILRKTDTKIGDVQPRNIFINPQGQIKVSSLYSWPNEKTNYQKLVFQNMLTLVSPEQFQLSRQGRVDVYSKLNNPNPVDKYLCQSFSIGLTMLSSTILTDCFTLYDNKGKLFDQKQLAKKVTKLLNNNNRNTKYSNALRISIAALCQIKPENRLSSLQLYEKLRQHDSQLSNLKPCNIQIPIVKNRQKYDSIIQKIQLAQNKQVNSQQNSNNQNVNANVQLGNNQYINYYQQPVNANKNFASTGSFGETPAPQSYNYNQNYNQGYGQNYNTNYASNLISRPSSTYVEPRKYDSAFNSGQYSFFPAPSNFYYDQSNPSRNSLYTPPSIAPNYGSTNIYSNYLTSTTYDNKFNQTPLKPSINPGTYATKQLQTTQKSYQTNFVGNNLSLQPNAQPKSSLPSISSGQIGPGNSYLYSIYSKPQPSQTTFKSVPLSSMGSNPVVGPVANKDIGDKAGGLLGQSDSKYGHYSFSNISSIPKQQLESNRKGNQSIGIFTPTQLTNNVNIGSNNSNRGGKLQEDSGIDLLRKIHEQIETSKQNFAY